MRKQLLLLVMMLLPMVASADAVEINGIYYNLSTEEFTATVISNPQKYSGDIVIPDNIKYADNYYTVNSIGELSFNGCIDLTSISLPQSLNRVEKYAFEGCINLKEVHISDIQSWCSASFEDLSSNPLYYAHKLFVNGNEIQNLIIPNGTLSIARYVFNGCSGFKTVSIPPSLQSIGGYAFEGCDNLTAVYISDLESWLKINFSYNSNPISKAHRLFLNDKELFEINIPNTITSINNYVFCGF